MARPEKVQIVEQLADQLGNAGSVFVADYAGLKVADVTDLRAQLREAGVSMRVAKNTLLRLAADRAGMQDLVDHFRGPTAVAFGGADGVAGAKIFQEFFTRLEKPLIRTFVIDKRSYDGVDLKAIAALPSREVLLAQLVAAIESPISSLISSIDGVMRDFVGTIDALAKKKEEGGA